MLGMTSLFNAKRKRTQNNNSGAILFSLLGLGIGTAIFSAIKGRNNGRMPAMDNLGNLFNKNQTNMGTSSNMGTLNQTQELLNEITK